MYDTFSAFGVILTTPKIQRDPESGNSKGSLNCPPKNNKDLRPTYMVLLFLYLLYASYIFYEVT